MKKLILGLSAIVLSLTAQNSIAFGPTGHRTVADIAQKHLSANAKAAIEKIIGKGPLAQLAIWPDSIKSDKAWRSCSSAWHYFSIDDNETWNKNIPRNKKGDILGALSHFEAVLKDEKVDKTYQCQASSEAPQSIKWQALAFYVHFSGDIHQPLHVGRRDDRGGNDVKVKWFNDNSNIHSVWDSKMLDLLGLSYTEHTAFINHPSDTQLSQWQSADYLDWAKESKSLRNQVYNFGNQDKSLPQLSYAYAYKNTDLLNQRILKAGVRLAGKLNQIFAH
jgi:hypothetical protein